MKRNLEVAPGVFLVWAAALLAMPLPLLLGAFFAAAVHELCHVLALTAFRIPILRLKLKVAGAEMMTGYISPFRELICAAAGPAGSLCLLLLIHRAPILSFFGFFQGIYNLLPIYPLDGGRMCHAIAEMLRSRHS